MAMLSVGMSETLSAADKTATLTIRGVAYHLTIVDTDASRALGLSGRKSLAKDDGMFFVFPRKEIQNFWMKDMYFPIDIIFMDDHKIVSIFNSVPPPRAGETLSELPIYTSTAPANAVLEVNAGEAKKHRFSVGDEVSVR